MSKKHAKVFLDYFDTIESTQMAFKEKVEDLVKKHGEFVNSHELLDTLYGVHDYLQWSFVRDV